MSHEIREQWPPRGWFDIRRFESPGLGETVATAFSRGRAEIIRDALNNAYPTSTQTALPPPNSCPSDPPLHT